MHGDVSSCIPYGYFKYYPKRLLILSSDIETNPGPGPGTKSGHRPDENTRLILNAIEETKEEVKYVKNQVDCVKNEIGCLREEIVSIKSKVESLEYGQEVIANDVASLSIADDQKEERLTNLELQLNFMESERLKSSLRIFGLGEFESERNSLESVIVDNVFDVIGKPDSFNESSLISAKRVGSIKEGEPRMVVAKFENCEKKFEIFKFREALREKGIRISNDLSFLQRKQVKEAKQRGLIAYFKNGKLVTYKPDDKQATDFDGTSRVFKRARRFGDKNQEDSQTDMDIGTTGEESGGCLTGVRR
jgi:hypothetical protein